MPNFTFHSNCIVTEDPNDYCHLVGFADQESAETYFMLQRAEEYDEQDRELGMDTYHVEWCGQENSGYGGISQFVLKRTSVEIEFDHAMADLLEGLNQLSITFDLTDKQYQALKQALRQIFEHCDCFKIAETDM